MKNESFSNNYEGNVFLRGLHRGFLSQLYGIRLDAAGVFRDRAYFVYEYAKRNEPFHIASKSKAKYNELNAMPEDVGFTIKDALKTGMLRLSGANRLYFRGRVLNPLENTIFHLLGNMQLPMDRLAEVSQAFFSQILEAGSGRDDRLVLLKNLLQLMGWGNVGMIAKKEAVTVSIKNPPYGFQAEKDNWEFVIGTILGFMRTIDKRFSLKKVEESRRMVSVTFSLQQGAVVVPASREFPPCHAAA